MNFFLLLLLSLLSTISFGQDWNIVNQNKTSFFQHSDSSHITNIIVIDSTLINGLNTIYYTGYAFKQCDSCVGFTYQNPIIYRYAKELLGFNIENDITNNQYSLDNNILRQHSQLGDTWAFNANLNATIIANTEQTILGLMDSIKIIELSNSDTIIIAKNYGVIRYPDFENAGKYYNFVGYHEGQNSYGQYLPNFWRTYDFNVGDVFCYKNSSSQVCDNKIYNLKLTILEILNQNNTITYVVKKLSMNEFQYEMCTENGSSIFSTSNFIDTISIDFELNSIENCYGTTQKNSVINFNQLTSNPIHFYGNLFSANIPTFNYLTNTFFQVSQIEVNDSLGTGKKIKLYEIYTDSLLKYTDNYIINEALFFNQYGRTFQHMQYDEVGNHSILVGMIKNGDTIGTIYNYTNNLGFKDNKQQHKIEFYPNPATLQITVLNHYKTITFYNNIGQLALTLNSPNTTIDISSLSKGIYFLRGTTVNGQVLNSKLLIE